MTFGILLVCLKNIGLNIDSDEEVRRRGERPEEYETKVAGGV
jgi:hypothetical protein